MEGCEMTKDKDQSTKNKGRKQKEKIAEGRGHKAVNKEQRKE